MRRSTPLVCLFLIGGVSLIPSAARGASLDAPASILSFLDGGEGPGFEGGGIPVSPALLAAVVGFGDPFGGSPAGSSRGSGPSGESKPFPSIGKAVALSIALPGLGHLRFDSPGMKAMGVFHISLDVACMVGMVAGLAWAGGADNGFDAFWASFSVAALGLMTLGLHRLECALETLIAGLLIRRGRSLERDSWIRRTEPPRGSRSVRFQFGAYWPCVARPLLGAPGEAGAERVLGCGFDMGFEFDLSRTLPLFARADLRAEGGTRNETLALVPAGFAAAAEDRAFLGSLGLAFGVGRVLYAFVRPGISQETVRMAGSTWSVKSETVGFCLGLGCGFRCTRGTALEFLANVNVPGSPHETLSRGITPVPLGSADRSLYLSLGIKGSF